MINIFLNGWFRGGGSRIVLCCVPHNTSSIECAVLRTYHMYAHCVPMNGRLVDGRTGGPFLGPRKICSPFLFLPREKKSLSLSANATAVAPFLFHVAVSSCCCRASSAPFMHSFIRSHPSISQRVTPSIRLLYSVSESSFPSISQARTASSSRFSSGEELSSVVARHWSGGREGNVLKRQPGINETFFAAT